MTDSLVYCIVCAALLSGVLGTPFRVLHLYSVGYDVEESAISVEEFASSHQSLLQVYNITVENVEDVECDERSSRRNFILAMLQRPAPLAVLDGACPRVSEAIAEISSIWNIPQISYSPFSSEFYTTEQQLAFPNFFSLYPSQQQLGQYIAALLQYFSWTKVSVLYQQDYTQIFNTMNTIFSEYNITVVQPVSYFEETSADDLFEDEAHIYVIMANSNSTRSILCKAAVENIVYPGYTFITPHWYEHNWWSVESHCTEQELTSVLNNTLSIALEPEHFYSDQPSSTALSPLSVYAYEGVQMLTDVLYHDPPTALNFTLNEQFQHLLNEEVNFYNRIRAADQMIVYQYRTEFQRGIEIRIVATISNNFNFVLVDNESTTTVWPDGVPPDGRPLLVISSVHLAVIIVFYIITLLGIIFAIACLVFNFVFRDRKIVKLTSPKLNYLIVAGALWIYVNLYFAVFPNIEDHPFAYEVLCNITYAAGIGTALSLGTIQGKMFRLFYIFRNPSPVKKKIKDWHIAMYVGVLVLVDIATYTTIVSVDALRPKAILVPNAEKQSTKNELQVSILYLAYSCGTYSLADNFIRLFLTFGHRYVLDVISVILALVSRKKIKVDVLNDAKYLQAIIYLHFINITIIFVVLVALGQYPNVRAICQCLSILEAPTDVLLFTFIPKMVNLYKDPNGEKIFVNTKPQEEVNTTGKISADGSNTDDKDIDQTP